MGERPAERLRRYGLEAKKSWGQNFLSDPQVLDRIVAACELAPGQPVVEIGPGLGALTEKLLMTGARVIGIERDRDMAAVLRAELGAEPRFALVEDNAVTVDLRQAAEAALGAPLDRGLVVAGNLPYHLSSPLLERFIAQREHLERIVIMLQREVAERLLARPGEDDYGALSIGIQLYADVARVTKVGPSAFVPPPKVWSEVVRLIPLATTRVPVKDERRFRALVRAAFQQRRKTLRNALRPLAEAEKLDLDRLLEAAGIDGTRRGETLDLADFARLADASLDPGTVKSHAGRGTDPAPEEA